MSKFEDIKKFINYLGVNQEFTRQSLIYEVGDGIDTYRKGLQDYGFIQSQRPGVFIKVKDIPDFVNAGNYRNRKLLNQKYFSEIFKQL